MECEQWAFASCRAAGRQGRVSGVGGQAPERVFCLCPLDESIRMDEPNRGRGLIAQI